MLTISPSSATAGSQQIVVTVSGAGFISGSQVEVNGAPRRTLVLTTTSLSFVLSNTDLSTAGVISLDVVGSGLLTYEPIYFSVNNPVPTVSSLSPPEATAGEASLIVTVFGSAFTPSTHLVVANSARPTTYLDSTHLLTTLTATDLIAVGNISIGARTNAPGGGSSQVIQLPVLAPVNPNINVMTLGALGSGFTTNGAIIAASTTLTLTSPWDTSATGSGIQILHAGAPIAIPPPQAPTVLPVSDPLVPAATSASPGATNCSYSVAALDEHGGESAASSPTSISDSHSRLDTTTYQNQIEWYGSAGASGYAVYGNCDGDWGLLTIIDLPMNSVFWTSQTAVSPGSTLVPFKQNGLLYRAHPVRFTVPTAIQQGISTIRLASLDGLVAGQYYDVDWGTAEEEIVKILSVNIADGSFVADFRYGHPVGVAFYGMTGVVEPNWPLLPQASVVDGAVKWVNAPFTVYDFGSPMVLASGALGFEIPSSISPTPPQQALADTLATSIVGTNPSRTEIEIGTPAISTVADQPVLHDDLRAIQTAVTQAQDSAVAYQLYPGGQFAYTEPIIEFPSGRYLIDAAINFDTGQLSVRGDQGAVIAQTSPAQDVIHVQTGGGLHATIAGMTFQGGRDSLWLSSEDVDGSMVSISGNTFLASLGFAIYSIGLEAPNGQRPNDIHLSQQILISDSLSFGCKHFVFTTSDVNILNNDWVEMDPANSEMDAAAISLFGADMQINGGIFIPSQLPYGAHWVDDYGEAFYSEGTRWSPEGSGGIPTVFDYENEYWSGGGGIGGRSFTSGSAWDTIISIKDGELTGGFAGPGMTNLGIVNCITGCPALMQITGNYYTAYNSVLLADPLDLDLDTYFTASPMDLEGRFLTAAQIHYTFDNNDASSTLSPSFPSQILPYTPNPFSPTIPESGNWSAGQVVIVGPSTELKVISSGKAAKKWSANASYTLNTIVEPSQGITGVYIAIQGGTSGLAQPAFSDCVNFGCSVQDGGVVWRYYGPVAQFAQDQP